MSRASFLSLRNRRLIPILSFITVAAIFSAVIIADHVYPFGDRCILRTDMYHQYAPFFMELKSKLSGGGSLLFSWDLGLGVNFLAIIAYYLASPLNLLLVIVPESLIIEFMTLLIVLKSALAGASMAVYLLSRDKRAGMSALTVSIFYGLSGYIAAYYWNIMWLDSVLLFPLVALTLERLIDGKSGVMYALTLGLSIITNYYISIPICIFLVIYFFMMSFLKGFDSPREFAGVLARFALFSLLAGCLSAVLVLPELYNFTLTASSVNTFPSSASDYFSLFSMLARHLPFTETEQGLDHWPNIYAGTFAIPFFFLYLSLKKVSLKEKVCYTAFSLFLLLGFAVNVLNFIWHGMHYPNSLPARQSFLYIFLVLFMCFRVLTNLRALSMRDIGRALGLSAAFILIAQEITKDDAFSILSFYPALILIAIYLGIIYLYRAGFIRRMSALIAVFIVAAAELSANTAYTSITTTSRTSFTADNASVRTLSLRAEELSGGEFYRMERAQRKSKNDGAWLGFPSASLFSSTVNADLSKLYKRLGMEASTNAYSTVGSTPLTDMLLGIRFTLSTGSGEETAISHIVSEESGMYLYEHDYALSLGFAMPEALTEGWVIEPGDPALIQNSIADALKSEQVLIPVYSGGASSEGEFALTIAEDGLYYAYEGETDAGDITVLWSDRKKTFSNLDRGYLIELGVLKKGELLNFKAEKSGRDPGISIFRLNTDAIGEIYEVLSASELKISELGDTLIRGSVTVDTEALGYSIDRAKMLITLPFDEGFKVYVDGVSADTFKGLDAFLSFYISSGTHEIEIRYTPVGFIPGAVLSLISLVALIALYLWGRRGYNKARCEEESDDIT